VAILPNPAPLLAAQLVSALNHVLNGQPWLCQRLVPFAGRTAELEMAPATLMVSVGADGQLVPAAADAAADVLVRIPVSAALMLATGDERARSRIQVTGDAAFAAVLAGVLQELRWDIEEDLSGIVGDIAAHRMVATGRSLLDWQRQAAHNLLQACAEFLTEERPVLAQRLEVERWVQDVDLLRDAVERLEKRIERLASLPRG
jgi:ubiquinone biosynthesis accessory factor UbiJ